MDSNDLHDSKQSSPRPRKGEIEEKAAAVLNEHGLETVPTDPVLLANRLGIRVHNATFANDSIAGMVAKRGSSITLLVNQSDSPQRKRFTIAHELGHHFLHLSKEDGDFVDDESSLDFFRPSGAEAPGLSLDNLKEVQANQFAAALLMPADIVRDFWQKLKDIDEMARLFQVSKSAMEIRLESLGIIYARSKFT